MIHDKHEQILHGRATRLALLNAQQRLMETAVRLSELKNKQHVVLESQRGRVINPPRFSSVRMAAASHHAVTDEKKSKSYTVLFRKWHKWLSSLKDQYRPP
jgi:hypothetical protein